MSEFNILFGGAEDAQRVKEDVAALKDINDSVTETSIEVEKIKRHAEEKEKALVTLVDQTVKKRRDQLVYNLDAEIAKAQSRQKKVRTEREKTKSKKVKQRINNETSGLVVENKNLREEIKTSNNRNGIFPLFNSDFIYRIFVPSGISDYLIIAVLFLALCVGMPALIMYLLKIHPVFEWIIAMLCVALVLGVYFLVYFHNKDYNYKYMKETEPNREKIKSNKKEIRKIKKEIKSDINEEQYNLGDYDDEIKEIGIEVDSLIEKKNACLNEFELVTKGEISSEIIAREQPKIDELKKMLNEKTLELRSYTEKQSQLSMKISTTYAKYMGNDFLYEDKLDEIKACIKSGKAQTIGEAVEILSGEKK